jgi:hypothetical protein
MKTLVIGGHFVCNDTLPKMAEMRSKLHADDCYTNADHHSLEQVLRRMLLKAVRVDEPQDCKFPTTYPTILNINSYPGKKKNLIPLLMMVLQPQAYVPSSVKYIGSNYNSLNETKNEVAVCKKVATYIAKAILADHLAVTTNDGQLHQLLKDMLDREDKGNLTKAHFALARKFLNFV